MDKLAVVLIGQAAVSAAQTIDPSDITKLLTLLGQVAVAIVGIISIFRKKPPQQ